MLPTNLFRNQRALRRFRVVTIYKRAGSVSGLASKSSIIDPNLGVLDDNSLSYDAPPPSQLAAASAIHTPFRHGDEIRLLRLQPLSGDGEVRCTLEHVGLSNKPVYDAVSYAWGEPVLSKRILVGNIMVPITENLHAALRQLAKMGSRQPLWVDALCINQSDSREKSHQVHMMGSIYAQAERALIWLGEEDDTSTSSMRFIRTVVALMDRHFSSKWEHLSFINDLTMPKDPTRFKDDLEHILAAPEWSHLSKLFQRPWFSRRWVVQEACLARRALVLCGSSSTSWTSFLSAVTLLRMYQHARNGPPGLENHLSTSSFLPSQWVRTSAWRPIQAKRKHAMTHPFLRFAGFACQDGRDYVFALLSLINMDSDVAYEPDYTKDTLTVYKEFAAHCLLQSGTLGVLHLAGSGPSTDENDSKLPSWVPDWRANTLLEPFLLGGRNVRFMAAGGNDVRLMASGGNVWFTAGSSNKPILNIDPATETLQIKGILVSTIAKSMPVGDLGATLNEHRVRLHSLRDMLLVDSPASYLTTEPFVQALARTFIADEAFPITQLNLRGLVKNHLASQGLAALRGLFFEFHEQLSSPSSHSEALGSLMHSGSLASMPGALDYFFTSSVILSGRSIIRTQLGHIGLSPKSAKVGDVVVVLQGGETPFVLRPQGPNGLYRLVGECYIHGIMYGSLWNEKIGTSLQEFTLG